MRMCKRPRWRCMAADGLFLDELLKDDELGAVLGRDRLAQLVTVEPRYDMADRILQRLGILQD